jgi:uncharacterized membrane protein YkgB
MAARGLYGCSDCLYSTMSADTQTNNRPDSIETVATRVRTYLTYVDQTVEAWLSRHGVTTLRYTLAIVFFWFGIIKPFDVSPADPLVENAIYFLPFEIFFPVLGWWEALVGLGLLFKRTVWIAVYLMVFQMLGTMIPLVTVPHMTFAQFPFVPSEAGAYIIKNWVLLSGGLVVLTAIEFDDDDADEHEEEEAVE